MSYLSKVSDDNKMFSDFSHTRTEGKNIYLDILKNQNKDYYMSKNNFKEKTEEIKQYFRLANE